MKEVMLYRKEDVRVFFEDALCVYMLVCRVFVVILLLLLVEVKVGTS